MTNTAKKKIANKLKDVRDNQELLKKENISRSDARFYNGAVQDYIPLLDIKDGVFVTKGHKYIACIEFAPINFHKLKIEQQQNVIRNFSNIFINGPARCSIEVLSDVSDPTPLIKSVYKNCPNQDDPKVADALSDYVQHIIRECTSNQSTAHRYFIQFEYTGDFEGKKSKDESEIITAINEQRNYIINQMQLCGNVCLDNPKNRDLQLAEYLYYFFNRKTSKIESFKNRYKRITNDFDMYNDTFGENKQVAWNDLVCPKGLSFTHTNYVLMDGSYYGYLGIVGATWPSVAVYSWVEIFIRDNPRADLKIVCRKVPKDQIMFVLKQSNKFSFEAAKSYDRKNKVEKAEKKYSVYKNDAAVYQALAGGEDLYDVGIIITFREDSEKRLNSTLRIVKQSLKKNGIAVDDCTFCTEQYFLMSLPFMYITPPFNRIKHNTLSHSLGALYPFTFYEMLDKSGYYIGDIEDTDSICILDNFNTKRFPNGNMIIIGSSGSGKTFTQQVIARGMLMNGIKCRFIIPKKGYEYQPGCEWVGGEYIKLGPNCSSVINPFDIRPEDELDTSKLNLDDVTIQRGVPLLAKKCNFLVEWYGLQLEDAADYNRTKRAELMEHISNVYNKYGITADNNSIYDENHNLKKMPVASDFLKEFESVGDMQDIAEITRLYVTGPFASMNTQTNVDLTNPYIVFDVDEDDIGTDYAPAFQDLAFGCVYDEARANVKVKKAIFLDEIWKMLKNESSAKMLENAIRIVRGYGACVIEATQQLNEILNSPGDFGKAIIGNSELRLLLHMKDVDADVASQALHLENSEVQFLMDCVKGQALLLTQKDRLHISIIASEKQKEVYSTDVNDKLIK